MSRNAHPAGPRHGDVLPDAHPAQAPADPNALDPAIWPASAQRVDGVLHLGGVAGHRAGRRARHAGAVPRRGRPARPGPRLHRGLRRRRRLLRRQGVPVHHGRALDRRGGARPRRLHRRRAGRRAGRRLPGRAHRRARQQQVRRRAARGPSHAGVGHVVLDSFDEIDRLADDRRRGRRPAARARPGDRRRRGPHPRVHRHRPRGPEVRLLAARRLGRPRGGRGAGRAVARSSAACTRTSARRSSRPPASRSPRTAW